MLKNLSAEFSKIINYQISTDQILTLKSLKEARAGYK